MLAEFSTECQRKDRELLARDSYYLASTPYLYKQRFNLELSPNQAFELTFSKLPSFGYLEYYYKNQVLATAGIENDNLVFAAYGNYPFIINSPLFLLSLVCDSQASLIFNNVVCLNKLQVVANSQEITFGSSLLVAQQAAISAANFIARGEVNSNRLSLTTTKNAHILANMKANRINLQIGEILNIGTADSLSDNQVVKLQGRQSVTINAYEINDYGAIISEVGKINLSYHKANLHPHSLITTKNNIYFTGEILESAAIIQSNCGGINFNINNLALMKVSVIKARKDITFNSEILKIDGAITSENHNLKFKAREMEISEVALLKCNLELYLMGDRLKNAALLKHFGSLVIDNRVFYNSNAIIVAAPFVLNNREYLENSGQIIYGNYKNGKSLIRTHLLKNTGKWLGVGEGEIIATKSLYNTGEFVMVDSDLESPNVTNLGIISLQNSIVNKVNIFKNNKSLILGGSNKLLNLEEFINLGSLKGRGELQITYQKLHNKSTWDFEGAFSSQGVQLINDHKAVWKMGNVVNNRAEKLVFDGHVLIAGYGAFDIKDLGKFSGFVHGAVLQFSSAAALSIDPSASFDVTHHLCFKARNTIDCDSELFTREPSSKEIPEMLKASLKSLRPGIFLTAGKYLSKKGQIIAQNGSVEMISKGSLDHKGSSRAGYTKNDFLRLSAKEVLDIEGRLNTEGWLLLNSGSNLKLAAGSQLNAERAQLEGKGNIYAGGEINIQEQLNTKSHSLILTGNVTAATTYFKVEQLIDIAGKIKAEDLLNIDSARDIVLRNTSQVSASNTNLKANNTIKASGLLKTQDTLIGNAQSIIQEGEMDSGTTLLNTQEGTTLRGKINANKVLSIKAGSDLTIHDTCQISAENSQLKAENHLETEGNIDIKDALLVEAKSYTHNGSTKANNLDISTDYNLDIRGNLSVSNYLQLASKQNISLHKNANIIAQIAALKAEHTIKSSANVKVHDSLSTRSLYFINCGTVDATNLHFKADRLFMNWGGGKMKGENINIDALLSANFFSLIKGKNLNINSVLDLNCGIRAFFNSNINSLISLSSGLDLPNIESMADIVNWRNFRNAAEVLLMNFAPSSIKTSYNLYRYSSQIPYLVSDAIQIISELKHIDSAKYGFSDFIPLICRSKNLVTSAAQNYRFNKLFFMDKYHQVQEQGLKQALSSNWDDFLREGQTLENSIQNFTHAYKNSQLLPVLEDYSERLTDFARNNIGTIISSFGPHFNTSSLFDINCGVRLGVNSYEFNLFNFNAGIKGFANSYALNTKFGYNYGANAAHRLWVDAANCYNSNGILFTAQGLLASPGLNIGGIAVGEFDIKGKSIKFGAYDPLERSKLHINSQEKFSQSGKAKVRQTHITAQEVDLQGELENSAEGFIKAEKLLTTRKGSRFTGEAVTVLTKMCAHSGAIESKKFTQINIEQNLNIEQQGVVLGKQILVHGDNITISGAIVAGESAIVAANKEIIHTGLIKAEEKIAINGKKVSNSGIVLGGKAASITAEQEVKQKGSVICGEKAVVHGQNVINTGIVSGGIVVSVTSDQKVTQYGIIRAEDQAIVCGQSETVATKQSYTKAAINLIGNKGISEKYERSKNTQIEDGAVIKSNITVATGDNIDYGALTQVEKLLIEGKTGTILNPEAIMAQKAELNFERYTGGAQSLIKLANKMHNIEQVNAKTTEDDFINSSPLNIKGEHRFFTFNDIDNKAQINSDGFLGLLSKNDFKTTENIHAGTGVYTKAESGTHQTLEGASITTTKGINYIESTKGIFLESKLDQNNHIKVATHQGEKIFRITGGNFKNLGGRVIASEELISQIKGDKIEEAVKCANNTLVENHDGSTELLRGSEKAQETYFRTQEFCGTIQEEIQGKFTTEAGIHRASNGGYIRVLHDIEGKALTHTYEADRGRKRSGFLWHKLTEWMTEASDFYLPSFQSSEGNLEVRSLAGTSNLEAPIFDISRKSTIAGGKGVNLLAVKTLENYKFKESNYFGFSTQESKGHRENAVTANLNSREKIRLESQKGNVLFQSPNINDLQGIELITPEGHSKNVPLVLEEEHNYKYSGFCANFGYNQKHLSQVNDIINRARNLANPQDGPTGVISDVFGLVTNLTNTAAQGARDYNSRSEIQNQGELKVGLGLYKGHIKVSKQLFGTMNAGGVSTIETPPDEKADLRYMHLNIDSLRSDTKGILLSGALNTLNSNEDQSQIGVSFKAESANPVISGSIGFSHDEYEIKTWQPAQISIGKLHNLRDDMIIEGGNIQSTIHVSEGEKYKIEIEDQQDEFVSKGYHSRVSAGFNLNTYALSGASFDVGKRALHYDYTPKKSSVIVGESEILPEITHRFKSDSKEGNEINIAFTSSGSARESGLSMPICVSGQSDGHRFRVEPVIINSSALKDDVNDIKRAYELHKEELNREKTRSAIADKILHGLTAGERSAAQADIARRITLQIYDEAHKPTDKYGRPQPRILEREGPIYINNEKELECNKIFDSEFRKIASHSQIAAEIEWANWCNSHRDGFECERPLDSDELQIIIIKSNIEEGSKNNIRREKKSIYKRPRKEDRIYIFYPLDSGSLVQPDLDLLLNNDSQIEQYKQAELHYVSIYNSLATVLEKPKINSLSELNTDQWELLCNAISNTTYDIPQVGLKWTEPEISWSKRQIRSLIEGAANVFNHVQPIKDCIEAHQQLLEILSIGKRLWNNNLGILLIDLAKSQASNYIFTWSKEQVKDYLLQNLYTKDEAQKPENKEIIETFVEWSHFIFSNLPSSQVSPEGSSQTCIVKSYTNTSSKKTYNYSNPNYKDALQRKLSALEKAQNNYTSMRVLSGGKIIRYYSKEIPARIQGKTRGATYVTEYNTVNKNVRAWMECYTHDGKVAMVHPKMINGLLLKSPHFPPTKAEKEACTRK